MFLNILLLPVVEAGLLVEFWSIILDLHNRPINFSMRNRNPFKVFDRRPRGELTGELNSASVAESKSVLLRDLGTSLAFRLFREGEVLVVVLLLVTRLLGWDAKVIS